MWATYTSTASAPARWWTSIRSAGSICLGRIPRRAGAIIWGCSCKRNPSRRKCKLIAGQRRTIGDRIRRRNTPTRRTNMKRIIALGLTITFELLITPNAQTRANANSAPTIGAAAPDFELKDLSGTPHGLKDYRGKLTVVAFISARCPISKMYQDRIRAVADEYAKRGVAFLAINSSADESVAEV